jgi:hypothetical protein
MVGSIKSIKRNDNHSFGFTCGSVCYDNKDVE